MPIVAVVGDTSTTTSLAVAATWSSSADLTLVEADPEGGDLAAWLRLPSSPSLATAVTTVREPSWPAIERHSRLTDAGVRVLACPWRSAEARHAVAESARQLVPAMAADRSRLAVVDCGSISVAARHPFVASAKITVVVHRQAPQSAAAAAVRLRRLVDTLEELSALSAVLTVALVGTAPFGIDEVVGLLGEAAGEVGGVTLPVDPLAAACLAGRAGVSARRLSRLPLMRAAADLASDIDRQLTRRAVGLGVL